MTVTFSARPVYDRAPTQGAHSVKNEIGMATMRQIATGFAIKGEIEQTF